MRRKQERDLAGLSYIDRVSIVRDDDLPDSLKPKKKALRRPGPMPTPLIGEELTGNVRRGR